MVGYVKACKVASTKQLIHFYNSCLTFPGNEAASALLHLASLSSCIECLAGSSTSRLTQCSACNFFICSKSISVKSSQEHSDKSLQNNNDLPPNQKNSCQQNHDKICFALLQLRKSVCAYRNENENEKKVDGEHECKKRFENVFLKCG